MKKTDGFTGRYPLSKTPRFKPLPVGSILENFRLDRLPDEDRKRA